LSDLLPYKDTEEATLPPSANSTRPRDEVDPLLALGELDDENNLRKAIVARENQVKELRNKAYDHATTVCFGFAAYLGLMVFLFAFGALDAISDQAQVAIFASPILSIAGITIFVIRGVFGTPSSKSVSEEIKQFSNFTDY